MTNIKTRFTLVSIIFFILSLQTSFGQVKILFDATKAEAAGNADWVIDADLNNIGYFNGPAQIGGTESNAQRIPTPLQSTLNSSSNESVWDGGISAWGVDCVKKGYIVESLPYNGQITYGQSSNAQDLSNYNVFIVCEPNILFTAAQKTAMLQFVQNGGGLFIISDHANSDRNGDGYDSQMIWNDFILNNSIQSNPFGFKFDSVDVSQISTNIAALASDTLLHGPFGNVTSLEYNNGATMTLSPTANATVKGIIYKNGSSNTGNTNVMMARARYGLGKVAALGDSSPADDGTGDPNDVLYDGYITGANGNHKKLIMNTTFWLVNNTATGLETNKATSFNVYPNPFNNTLTVTLSENRESTFEVIDLTGKIVSSTMTKGEETISIELSNLPSGIYILRNKNNIDDYYKIIKN